MILVTGATGQLGAAVVDFLLNKTDAKNIAVLVRNPEKARDLQAKGAQIRIADYDNLPDLVHAFTGVDKLFFVSGTDIANRSQQQLNVVEAAKKAGVGHVVYTSFQRQNETDSSPIAFVAKSHLDTEIALKKAGIPFTILKNGLYTDMLPMFMGEQVLETGTIFFPSGAGKAAFVLRNDLAEASANILTTQGHEGKTYELAGAESLSFTDIAGLLSSVAGKPVAYVSPSLEVYDQELSKAGVPAAYIGMFAGFGEAIRQGEFSDNSSDLTRLLGRQPVPAAVYLKQVYG